ncbi:hypothetical protein ACEPPN_000361 [Leptodophora sp. 'Broadleaf-Isolate-01']
MTRGSQSRFSCSEDNCRKTFSRKGDKRRHIDEAHGAVKHCGFPECSWKGARRLDRVKEHIEEKHLKLLSFHIEQWRQWIREGVVLDWEHTTEQRRRNRPITTGVVGDSKVIHLEQIRKLPIVPTNGARWLEYETMLLMVLKNILHGLDIWPFISRELARICPRPSPYTSTQCRDKWIEEERWTELELETIPKLFERYSRGAYGLNLWGYIATEMTFMCPRLSPHTVSDCCEKWMEGQGWTKSQLRNVFEIFDNHGNNNGQLRIQDYPHGESFYRAGFHDHRVRMEYRIVLGIKQAESDSGANGFLINFRRLSDWDSPCSFFETITPLGKLSSSRAGRTFPVGSLDDSDDGSFEFYSSSEFDSCSEADSVSILDIDEDDPMIPGADTIVTETLDPVLEIETPPLEIAPGEILPPRRVPRRHVNYNYGSQLSNQDGKDGENLESWPPEKLRLTSENNVDFPRYCGLNRFMLIECNTTNCFIEKSHLTEGNEQRCSNRPITNLSQRGREDYLSVTTGPCGKGLRTERDIAQDEIILEYKGQILSEAQVKRKKNRRYVYELRNRNFRKRLFLDALNEKWGKGRFPNHDCDPNSRMEEWIVDGYVRVVLAAIRDIAKGEEIRFDYQGRVGFEEGCLCGSKLCRFPKESKQRVNASQQPFLQPTQRDLIHTPDYCGGPPLTSTYYSPSPAPQRSPFPPMEQSPNVSHSPSNRISPLSIYSCSNIAHDRPFKCDQCPQSFNRNHDLKRHKWIHLGVKPFPCGHCEKSFSRKHALKRHIRVKGCGKNANGASNADADEHTVIDNSEVMGDSAEGESLES